MEFAPAPEYSVWPTGRDLTRTRPRCARSRRPPARSSGPSTRTPWSPTSSPWPAGWPRSARGGRGPRSIPHVLPTGEPGMPPYSVGARLPRTRAGARGWGLLRPLLARGEERGRRELNARARAGGPAAAGAHPRRDLPAARAGRHLPAARVPASRPRPVGAGDRPAAVGAPFGEVEDAAGRRPAGAGGAEHLAGPRPRMLRAALEGLAGEPVRVLGTTNRREPPAPLAVPAERPRGGLALLRPHDAALRRGDLPRGARHGGAVAGERRAGDRLPRRPATWPRTPRGWPGPAAGSRCRAGWSRRAGSGWRCGSCWREPALRGAARRELAEWARRHDGGDAGGGGGGGPGRLRLRGWDSNPQPIG